MSRQAVDQMLRNLCLAIDRDRIKMFIEKLPDFCERFVQLRLLRRRNPRIRHYPVRNETPQKKSLCESKRLRTGEKQLLRLFDFLLPLNLRLVHKLQM